MPPAALAKRLVPMAVSALLAMLASAPAVAEHAEARFDYCGFGLGPARGRYEPRGGGDTVVLSGQYANINHFVYDSASPVTLNTHDRVVMATKRPRDIEVRRIGDSLAVCDLANRYEMFIKNHFCRSASLSSVDNPNNEIEEFRLIAAGEIWLSDVLYDAYLESPDGLDTSRPSLGDPPGPWMVRPFRDVMPSIGADDSVRVTARRSSNKKARRSPLQRAARRRHRHCARSSDPVGQTVSSDCP